MKLYEENEILNYILFRFKNPVKNINKGFIKGDLEKFTTLRYDSDNLNIFPDTHVVLTILNTISQYYKMPEELIISKCREVKVTTARQVAMYIFSEHYSIKHDKIALIFNYTEIEAVGKTLQLFKVKVGTKEEIKEDVNNILNLLNR